MTWWGWMILGAVLLGAELSASGAPRITGSSAVVVGLASLFGIVMPEWAQWLTFAIVALLFFVTFRKALYNKIRGGGQGFADTISGGSVTVTNEVLPGANGRAKYRGSEWTIRNVGERAISSGARAKVVQVDGLTLHVEAE